MRWVRVLRRQGGSTALTIPTILADLLGFETGDLMLIDCNPEDGVIHVSRVPNPQELDPFLILENARATRRKTFSVRGKWGNLDSSGLTPRQLQDLKRRLEKNSSKSDQTESSTPPGPPTPTD
jgi:hypothetical protein